MPELFDGAGCQDMTAGSLGEADFDAGALALDFVNSATGSNRGAGRWDDALPDAFAALTWLRRREALGEDMFRALMRIAASDETASIDFMTDLRRLRAALGRILAAAIAGGRPDATDLALLDSCGGDGKATSRLVWGGNGLRRARDEEVGLAHALRIVAGSAEQILTVERLPRIKVCASTTCQWLFLDTSKNGSRRWCRMDVCGNREKGRRRLQRERTAECIHGDRAQRSSETGSSG